jgi:hypothetical protein
MSQDAVSLKAFILGDPPNAALSECVASVTAALGASPVDVRHFDWSGLAGDITEKLEEMFDIKLVDVFSSAWKDYEALIDCADPSKHTADETISLPMVDHSIETTLRPCFEVTIGPRPPIRVTFEIACELDLKGLVLKIQDAAIRAIRIASCRAKASVKCHGILLIRRETKELDLPGKITLPRGIPIGRSLTSTVVKSEGRKSQCDTADRELATADLTLPAI